MRIMPVLVVAACASTPPSPQGGPRGLRTSEHLEEARMHERTARHRFAGREEDDAPWAWRWDTAAEDERAAAMHRSQAAALIAEYEQACRGQPPAEISTSPLRRHGIGGSPTSDGVILYLAPTAGSADRLLAGLKCHRAWMMLAPAADMDDCPLDLPGIVVDASGDAEGITVTIGSRDPDVVAELQRRAARELERSGQLQRR